jgi:hypothetical protein
MKGKRETEEERKERRQKKNKENLKCIRYTDTLRTIPSYLNTGPSVSSMVIIKGIAVCLPDNFFFVPLIKLMNWLHWFNELKISIRNKKLD